MMRYLGHRYLAYYQLAGWVPGADAPGTSPLSELGTFLTLQTHHMRPTEKNPFGGLSPRALDLPPLSRLSSLQTPFEQLFNNLLLIIQPHGRRCTSPLSRTSRSGTEATWRGPHPWRCMVGAAPQHVLHRACCQGSMVKCATQLCAVMESMTSPSNGCQNSS